MNDEGLMTHLNKQYLEYDIIKMLYVNEDKIPNLVEKFYNSDKSDKSNKIYNVSKYFNKLKINKYGLLYNYNYIDFFKNIQNIQNIKIENKQYKTMELYKNNSIEEV